MQCVLDAGTRALTDCRVRFVCVCPEALRLNALALRYEIDVNTIGVFSEPDETSDTWT